MPPKGHLQTKEAKQKMSLAHLGVPLSEENRKHISEALRGRHYRKSEKQRKGRQQSEETKRKISESLNGRILGSFTEEHKKKLSESNKGKHSGSKSVPYTANCYKYPTKIESLLYSFLDSFNVLYFRNVNIYLENTVRRPDVLIPPNIIIEADGEQHYKICRGIFRERSVNQIRRDKDIDPELKKMGYNVCRIPYWKFENGEYKETLLKALGGF